MSVLHIRYREMVAAAEELIKGAEDVKSRYGSTKGDVEKLLHGSWKGIAPEVHKELWADWDEGFGLVQAAMIEMAQHIITTAKALREASSDL